MNSYIEKTINSLKEHYNFEYIQDVNMPINIEFDHLKNSRVVIKQQVLEKLNNIALTTQIDSKEIGFLIYGKEFLPNQVYFNKIIVSDAPLKSIEASFGKKITEDLKSKIDENLDDRITVAHGHSHPKLSPDYDKFSLGDLTSYLELTLEVEDFKNKDMQLVGCLITPDLPIKFIYYNPYDDKFYDFEKIEIEQ